MEKIIKITLVLGLLTGIFPINAKLKIGMEADIAVGSVSQKKKFRIVENDNIKKKNHMGTSLDFYLKAKEKADNGIKYGGVVVLNTKTKKNIDDTQYTDLVMKRAYIFINQKHMGEVQLGNGYSASRLMNLNAFNFARGGAGLNGNFTDYVSNEIISSNYKPELFINSVHHISDIDSRDRRANKITYISPKLSGFQVGLSYTPDIENIGEHEVQGLSYIAYYSDPKIKNLVNTGFSYETKVNNIGFKTSLTSEFGKAKKIDSDSEHYKNLSSHQLGIALSYNKFILSASYQKQGESLGDKEAKILQKAKFCTAGLSYSKKKFGVSLTHFSGVKTKYKTRVTSLDLDYKLFKGITPYLSISKFVYRAPSSKFYIPDFPSVKGGVIKNRGHLFLVGIKAIF